MKYLSLYGVLLLAVISTRGFAASSAQYADINGSTADVAGHATSSNYSNHASLGQSITVGTSTSTNYQTRMGFFTTLLSIAPEVNSLSPADDATNVSTTENLIITFSEAISKGTGNIVIKKSSDDSVVETIPVTDAKVSLSVNKEVVTINPATTLAKDTAYYVTMASTAFLDSIGNNYVGIADNDKTTWNFTTVANVVPTLTTFTAPVATGNEDAAIEITLTALKTQGNEADSDGTVDAFVVTAVSTGSLKIGTDVSSATAFVADTNDTIDASKHAYWTPVTNANGLLDAFHVKAEDNDGASSATAVLAKVNVTAVNDPPEGQDDTGYTTDYDVPLEITNALANDTDPEDDTLSIIRVGNAKYGTVRLVDGKLQYTPGCLPGTDTFTYTVSDGNGGTDQATVTITVAPPPTDNRAPCLYHLTVVGTPALNRTLTAMPGYFGDPNGDTFSTVYQWSASDSVACDNLMPISGATASTYSLTEAEIGKFVCLTMTLTDNHGVQGDPVTSSTNRKVRRVPLLHRWKLGSRAIR